MAVVTPKLFSMRFVTGRAFVKVCGRLSPWLLALFQIAMSQPQPHRQPQSSPTRSPAPGAPPTPTHIHKPTHRNKALTLPTPGTLRMGSVLMKAATCSLVDPSTYCSAAAQHSTARGGLEGRHPRKSCCECHLRGKGRESAGVGGVQGGLHDLPGRL